MKKQTSDIHGIACGIFEREIEELIRQGRLAVSFTYLDSMLHMSPALLEKTMEETLAASGCRKIILVYGDCQPRMHEMTNRPGISRTSGLNCCEIILGRERYRKLRREGAFFLLPEWTERWKDVFQGHLGFSRKSAGEFMGEMHTNLLYLDTGITPVPVQTLKEASDFCGLPFDILEVKLDHLLKVILHAALKLEETP